MRLGVLCIFVLFCVLVFCTGHFVMVPVNLTCLHFYNILSLKISLKNSRIVSTHQYLFPPRQLSNITDWPKEIWSTSEIPCQWIHLSTNAHAITISQDEVYTQTLYIGLHFAVNISVRPRRSYSKIIMFRPGQTFAMFGQVHVLKTIRYI